MSVINFSYKLCYQFMFASTFTMYLLTVNNLYNCFLADHISHLISADDQTIDNMVILLFDLDNIALTIDTEAKKPIIERDYVIEEIYNSIYFVSFTNKTCYF